MNSFELEFYSREKEQELLKETKTIRSNCDTLPEAGVTKRLVLAFSEFLIFLGTSLHNLYQPSIEETLLNYKSAYLE